MLTLAGAAKGYGDRTLFEDLNLTLSPTDRLGLVGPNGSGKTTLLRVLAGELSLDRGTRSLERRATVGILAQELPKYTGRSLLEELLAGHERYAALTRELAALEEALRRDADPAHHEELAHRHGDALHAFEAIGGYELPVTGKKILAGLGFKEADFERRTEEFSGGWLMRLALARLLLAVPDVLLLDEPTNYLDLESVIWLESYLRDRAGALVLASHDRTLLNTLCNRILEIADGRTTAYAGNYEDYIAARDLRLEQQEATARNQARERARVLRFVERFRYKNTKARQVQSRIKKLERMEVVSAPRARRRLRVRLPSPPPAGRILIELREVSKAYDTNVVYTKLDLSIERGDRVALVGPNGAGKSTLLKMLAGVLPPTSGERRVESRARLGYYAQHQVEALHYGNTIYEEVQQAAPGLVPEQVRGLLGRFLFSGDDAFKTIGVLSGGEKARVALAKMLCNPPNLLLMDEPTSHLDIAARENLEEALAEYEGALVMISHDREFLERLANRIVEVGGGRARSYLGTYSEYLDKKEEKEARATAPPPPTASPKAAPTREAKREKAEARNQRYRRLKPVREKLERLEREIASLEARVAELEAKLADPGFYGERAAFGETFRSYQALKAEIASKTERWGELGGEMERIEGNGA